jgi:hypothetical protein
MSLTPSGQYVSNRETPGGDVNNIAIVYSNSIGGQQRIQNLSADVMSCKYFTIEPGGAVSIPGITSGNVIIGDGFSLSLPNGASDNLAAKFTTSPNTGIYLSTGINIQYNGNPAINITDTNTTISNNLIVPQIITNSGNLSLNPNGPAIDFNGKNLINVGGIQPNPYAYKIIAPATIITSSATNYTLLSIGISPNTGMQVNVNIIGIDSTAISSISFSQTLKIMNNAGTITYLTFDKITAEDPSLFNATLSYTPASNALLVQINPGISTTTKWFGTADVILQAF